MKDKSDPNNAEDDSIGDDFDNESVAEFESIEDGDEATSVDMGSC